MLQIHRSGNALLLEGGLTIYEVAETKVRFTRELAGDPALEVDLSGLQELDTAGAQLLLWVKREGLGKGWNIPFNGHSSAVLDVFEQLNLAGLFGDTLLIAPTREGPHHGFGPG
jgi:anti-sigma B factor antagonist